MIDKLEDFHWYNGLHNEVVVEDCYGLRTIDWVPDVIFDIGANIGVFSRYARELFPTSRIVAIEPDPVNCELFRKFTADGNLLLLEKAIGDKPVWKHGGSINSIYTYTSPGLGYRIEDMEQMRSDEDTSGHMKETSIPTILPAELLDTYTVRGQKILMKIDCEGGENAIWTDPSSLDKMRNIDFLAIELHWFSNRGGSDHDRVQEETVKALLSFKETHRFTLTNILFTARKKP